MSQEVFRNALDNLLKQGKIKSSEVLTELLLQSDVARERFLKARQYDLDKTISLLLDARQYRIDHDLDNILTKPMSNVAVIRANYISGWHKRDLQGNPVYIDMVGQLKVDNLQREVTMEEMLFAHHHGNEYLTRIIHRADSKTPTVGKITSIIDLKGLGWKHLSKTVINFMGSTSKADQMLFPEMLNVCVIVNAGYLFQFIWKAIKPFLEERTQKKILVCNDNGLSTLTKYIALEDIPVVLGGKCCCHGDCINRSQFVTDYLKHIESCASKQELPSC